MQTDIAALFKGNVYVTIVFCSVMFEILFIGV